MSLTRVSTDRLQFAVRDSGSGSPVVFLHGYPQSSYCWEGVVTRLGDGFRLIRPDLRGLGDSERRGDWRAYRKLELAKDILHLLDVIGVDRFALVGHDWGAAVAQEAAMLAPERVTRLVVMSMPLINDLEAGRRVRAMHAGASINRNWYQDFLMMPNLAEEFLPGREEVWMRFMHFTSHKDNPFPEAAIQEYVRCYSIQGTAASGANYYRSMLLDARGWVKHQQKKFTMPSLIINGARDPVIVDDYFVDRRQRFNNVRFVSIDAGHFLPDESPDLVAVELRRFLSA